MKIHHVNDSKAGAQLTATLFAEASRAATDRPVGLATGATMTEVYTALAQQGFAPEFGNAFALDEYAEIAADHRNSYDRELREKFSYPLGWLGTLHVPGQGRYGQPGGEELFEQSLLNLGPLSVQLLGLGVNGHIAFNEPGAAFNSRTRRVELHPETVASNSVFFNDPTLMPTHAVSQGLGTIAQAISLLVLVLGPSKHPALSKALDHPDASTPLVTALSEFPRSCSSKFPRSRG